jgi:hypothetical protein
LSDDEDGETTAAKAAPNTTAADGFVAQSATADTAAAATYASGVGSSSDASKYNSAALSFHLSTQALAQKQQLSEAADVVMADTKAAADSVAAVGDKASVLGDVAFHGTAPPIPRSHLSLAPPLPATQK